MSKLALPPGVVYDAECRACQRLAAFRDLSGGHTAESERSAFRIVDTIRRQLAESGPGSRSA